MSITREMDRYILVRAYNEMQFSGVQMDGLAMRGSWIPLTDIVLGAGGRAHVATYYMKTFVKM